MKFFQEEINLMCIYDTSSKTELLKHLHMSIQYIENKELKEITNTVIHKLESMTNEEYLQLKILPTVSAEDMED